MDKFRMLRLLAMVAIMVAYRWYQPKTKPLQKPHHYSVLNDFLSDEEHVNMMKMFEDLGDYPAARADWTSTKWMSIGEEYEPSADGQCRKTWTILNEQTGKCQLPNRIDIGKHFIETGGYNGWKESYPKMIHRLHPFINYQFDAFSRPEFVELFERNEFITEVARMCGRMNPYFRPFQLSMILNIPGQSVPMHLDIPYFWPATRYSFPQWLLLVMQDSDIFKQQRLPQVQALVYVHDWKVANQTNTDLYRTFGGEFIVYPQGPQYKSLAIPATPKSAIFCDGSEMVHGTSTYKADIEPYQFDKDLATKMSFDKENNVWRLYVDQKATETVYSWQDIRASIAYRGWCFSDKEVMDSWDPYEWSGDLSLEDIMDIFKQDLVEKKKLISADKWDGMDAYETALYLLTTYIKLPKPVLSRIPFNYCLVFEKLPSFVKVIENFLC